MVFYMFRASRLLISFILIWAFDLKAQIYLDTSYSIGASNYAASLCLDLDSNFLVPVRARNGFSGAIEPWVCRISATGNLLDSKLIPMPAHLSNFRNAFNGSIYKLGNYFYNVGYCSINDSSIAVLVKLDANLDTVFVKTYRPNSKIQTNFGSLNVDNNGNLIMVGSQERGTYIVKADTNGKMIFSKSFNGGYLYIANRVSINSNNQILISISDYVTDRLENFGYILLNSDGTLISKKRMTSTANQGEFATFLQNGDILYYGCTVDTSNSNMRFPIMIRLDASGNEKWRKVFKDVPFGTNCFMDAIEDTSGNITSCGYTAWGNGVIGNTDNTITKQDSSGNIIWQRIFRRGTEMDKPLSIIHLQNGYAVVGWLFRNAETQKQHFTLYTTDVYGCLQPGCQTTDDLVELSPNREMGVYPNPTTDWLHVIVENGTTIRHITILNSLGQTIQNVDEPDNKSINVSLLPAGNYFLRIQLEDQVSIVKFLKMQH